MTPFRWQNCYADVAAGKHDLTIRSFLDDVILPAIRQVEARIAELGHSDEPAACFEKSDMEDVLAETKLAFMRPDKQAEKQAMWDSQVNLSYLLGLDWTIPFEIKKVRQRENQLKELKKAAEGGAVGDIIGTVAELRPRVVLAEANVEKLRVDLAAFRVVDTYREMSDRASAIRGEMLAIERNAVILKQTLDHLETSYRDEQPPAITNVARLYRAVGIELPTVAVRRFEEVKAFHESVVANRRKRLQEQIDSTKLELSDGETRSALLDGERSEILGFLKGSGAFEDLTALQEQLARRAFEAAALRERFKAAEVLEGEVEVSPRSRYSAWTSRCYRSPQTPSWGLAF